jgi:hypothetical protein
MIADFLLPRRDLKQLERNPLLAMINDAIENIIDPFNQLMAQVTKHPQFIYGDEAYIESLIEGRSTDFNFILGYFPSEAAALHFSICYLVGSQCIKEYVKLTMQGLRFHEQSFESLEDLLDFFQRKNHKESYRSLIYASSTLTKGK